MRFTASMGFVALFLALLVPAGAQVDIEEKAVPEKVEYDAISTELDLELKTLVFSLGEEGEEPVDCSEAVINAEGDEPTTDVEGCQVVSIAGPNGQVNHGSIVSSMAHQFGPGKGKLMRHIAQSDLGKGDQKAKADDSEGDEVEAEDDDAPKPEGWMPPGQAKKRNK